MLHDVFMQTLLYPPW